MRRRDQANDLKGPNDTTTAESCNGGTSLASKTGRRGLRANGICGGASDLLLSSGSFYEEFNERFLFAVGMKRIWAVVNGSYWLLDNSLTLGERNEVTSYQVGSAYQRRGGDLHLALRTLRNDLHSYFVEQELDDVVEARSPREVLARLTERDSEEWT